MMVMCVNCKKEKRSKCKFMCKYQALDTDDVKMKAFKKKNRSYSFKGEFDLCLAICPKFELIVLNFLVTPS